MAQADVACVSVSRARARGDRKGECDVASLILGAVGSAIGGPIGGAIGALIGGILDSQVIAPFLFPQTPLAGPGITELKLQTQDEGAPANWIVGGTPRVAGTIIWISDLIQETITVSAGGGKGGGGGSKVKKKIYFCHMAIAVAVDDAQPSIYDWGRIFADGKVLYNPHPNVALAGSMTVTVLGSGAKRRMKVLSAAGGPDLSQLQTAHDATIAGATNAANNGVFRCTDSAKDTALGTSYAVFKNNACIAEGPSGLTINQTLPTHQKKKLAGIAFYNGFASQTPDPLMESYKGAGNVPGYRGTAYVVFEKLALEDYGNRPPLMHFIVTGGPDLTVAGALTKIMKRAGRTAAEIDVAAVSDLLGGFATSGPQSMAQVMQPLLLAFNLLPQETNGVIRFFPRAQATVLDLDPAKLVAHEGGTEGGSRPLQIEDFPDATLPQEVNVKYVDLERDDLAGSERERRRDNLTDNVVNVDLPLVLTSKQARGMARRFLWIPWANRHLFRYSLPPSEVEAQENDCQRTKVLGEPVLLLISRITRGFNEVIDVEAVREQRDILTQLEEGNAPDNVIVSGSQEPVPDGVIFEGPILEPSAGAPSQGPTIYGGGATEGRFGNGMLIWVSDDDEDWTLLFEIETESIFGYGGASLKGGVEAFKWDRKNSVTVTLLKGSLSSRPELDVLNGANRARIGEEYIGFATATLVAERTYTLTNLIRGLRNTEDKIASHTDDEPFLLLTEGEVGGAVVNYSWIGSKRYFRMVPAGSDVDDFGPSTEITMTGLSLRPFNPTAPIKAVLPSGDWRFDWRRRTRVITRLYSAVIPPLAEETERYDAEVEYPPGSGTIVKSWADLQTPSATLAVGEKGPIPDGATVRLRVWQKSVAYGRGVPLVQDL